MFVLCIFAGTLCASEEGAPSLQSPTGEGYVVVGSADDLVDALHTEHHNEQRLNSPVPKILAVEASIDRLVGDEPKKKELNQLDGVTVKQCKQAVAGVLLGGSLSALVHDCYGTTGDVVFSLVTGATFVASRRLQQAVFAEYHVKVLSPEGRFFESGFFLGAQLPLVTSVFFRNRK